MIISGGYKWHCPECGLALWLSLLSTVNFTSTSEMSFENGTGNFDSWHLHLQFTTVTHPSPDSRKLHIIFYRQSDFSRHLSCVIFFDKGRNRNTDWNFLCRLFLLVSGISLNITQKFRISAVYAQSRDYTYFNIPIRRTWILLFLTRAKIISIL